MGNDCSKKIPQSCVANSLEPLKDGILAYVNDAKHSYAVGLEGEWGSGKTWYLDSVIRPVLKDVNRLMVRVSLFVVESQDELYEGIVLALLRLDGESNKMKELGKTGLKQIPSLVKRFGLNLNLNASMKTLIDLLLRKEKHVFVFDDLERRARGNDDHLIFGAINDLVENRGYKAIIVSNALTSDNQKRGDTLDSNIREKLIWRVFKFSPKPSDLALDIFGEIQNDTAGFNVMDAVVMAAEEARCRNARAMLKADELIRHLCRIPCVADDKIALESRKAALVDVVKYCLLVCMECPPVKPEIDNSHGGVTPELFASFSLEEDYEKYSDLPILPEILKTSGVINSDDLDAEVRAFIEKRYPDSPDTVVLKRIVSLLINIPQMEDDEINKVIPEFKELVERASFSPELIGKVVSFNNQLRSIGFTTLFDDDELVVLCQKVIDKNPKTAYEQFRGSTLAFVVSEGDEILNGLCGYAEESYKKLMTRRDVHLGKKCGVELAYAIRRALEKDTNLLLQFVPAEIAKCFECSNGQGQEEIRSAILSLRSRFVLKDGGNKSYIAWIQELKGQVESCEMSGNLDVMRKNWFLSNLDDLIQLSSA